MNPWTTVRFPWRRGPVPAGETVWITASRLSFASLPTLIAAGPDALRLRAGWSTMPGAVGLSMRIEPRRLASWTVSVWADEEASRAFIHSTAHQRVMKEFGPRGVTGAELGWTAPQIDLVDCWDRATTELSPRSPV